MIQNPDTYMLSYLHHPSDGATCGSVETERHVSDAADGALLHKLPVESRRVPQCFSSSASHGTPSAGLLVNHTCKHTYPHVQGTQYRKVDTTTALSKQAEVPGRSVFHVCAIMLTWHTCRL